MPASVFKSYKVLYNMVFSEPPQPKGRSKDLQSNFLHYIYKILHWFMQVSLKVSMDTKKNNVES